MNQPLHKHNRGYILLPVVLLLSLLATIAFLVNRQNAVPLRLAANQAEEDRVQAVAEAGLEHAKWLVQDSVCGGDLTLGATALGDHSYTATVDAAASATNHYTFQPDRDAVIKETAPAANFGSSNPMGVKYKTGQNQRTLCHFDLAAIPVGARVTSATLRIYVVDNDSLGGVNFHPVTESWAENDVTWNTIAAAHDPQVVGSISQQLSGNAWVAVNLTAMVQNWINNPTENHGLMLIGALENSGGSSYASREDGGHAPSLEVSTAVGATSPVSITATGTLDSGVTRTLYRSAYKAYQQSTTITLQPDAAGEDAEIWDQAPNHNYGNAKETWVSSASTDTSRTMLRFNLDAIPAGARILGAKLSLLRWSGSGADQPVSAHRVKNSWTEDSVSWNKRDGVTNWDTPGGDFDATAVATTPVGPDNTRYEWDLKPLVQGWVDNSYPNCGIELTGAIPGMPGERFYTSDEDDPTRRPKLTITYACECGTAGVVPRGSGRVLIISHDYDLTSAERFKKELFESWGYTVTSISQYEAAWNFNSHAADNDVAYVSDEVDSGTWGLGTALAAATIGVVNEEGGLYDNLGIASGGVSSVAGAVEIVDTSHFITRVFPAGSLPIYTAPMEVKGVSGPAPGLHILASWGGTGCLTTLEKGDALAGGGTAAGRRVTLPLGNSTSLNWAYVSTSGRLLVQRALQWAASQPAVQLGPIAHWKLDDGNGTTALDVAGGHDGSVNGASWTTGRLNGALAFNGTSDFVDIGSPSQLENVFDGGATVTAWIKPSGWGEGGFGRILDKADNLGGNRNGWCFELYGSYQSLFFQHGFSGGIGNFRTDTGSISLDTWQHVAVVYDNSSAANDPIIYINGIPQTVIETSSPSGNRLSDSALTLMMGNYSIDYSRTFDGLLDDVRIYDRMLSADEIAALANYSPEYLDDFNRRSCDAADYTGSDGTLDWSPWSWVEPAEGDGSCAGLTFIGADPDVPEAGSNRLVLKGKGAAAWRQADISSFNKAYLSFDYRRDNYPTTNDFFRVMVSSDGSTWTVLETISGIADDASYQHASYDITAWIGPGTTIGFMTGGINTIQTLYLDHVRISESPGGAGTRTCRDEFNAKSFAGSDGSRPWSTDWLEVGESDGPTSGDEIVDHDLSDYQLRLRDNDNGGEGVEREADLSGATSATLNVEYRRNKLDNSNDYVKIMVSANGAGGPWTEVGRLAGPTNDSTYQSASYDISPYIAANTRIRLVTSPTMGSQDVIWFDNIEISFSP